MQFEMPYVYSWEFLYYWKRLGENGPGSMMRLVIEECWRDRWYASSNTLQMIREALPHVRAIFTTGGEPMLIKEHLKILEMIIEEGHADHILLRYNSNQTVIPKKIVELWKHFQTVVFNCSVEGSWNAQ